MPPVLQLSLQPLYGGGFTVAVTQVIVVYYSVAFLLHFVVPRLLPVRSVQLGRRRPSQAAKEAFNCSGPLLVKAAVLTAVERLHAAGYGLLYSGWPQTWQQWLYIASTIAALDYFHDAWFYWMHRLLHWKPLYRHVHYLHHRATVPTAFSGYSFHVAEAALVFCNEVVEVFFFPIHVGLHRMYHLYTTLIHIGGHVGYEIAPLIPSLEALLWALLTRGAPAKGLNTVAHHDMHHRFPNRHFSLYFTHWDRWCGTQHPQYVHRTFADLPQPPVTDSSEGGKERPPSVGSREASTQRSNGGFQIGEGHPQISACDHGRGRPAGTRSNATAQVAAAPPERQQFQRQQCRVAGSAIVAGTSLLDGGSSNLLSSLSCS